MADSLLALREYAKLAPWNIRDLATIAGGILDASGVTPINAAAQSQPSDRTIRFYVTRHLMSAPDGRGTAATYAYRHLLQLLGIKLRQMEGATLGSIERELAEAPGDVLEKRVASSLVNVPLPAELSVQVRGVPRGRVARILAPRAAATAPVRGPEVPAPAGSWFRIPIADTVELSIRADHPAARDAGVRQRVADAVARALAESADADAQ